MHKTPPPPKKRDPKGNKEFFSNLLKTRILKFLGQENLNAQEKPPKSIGYPKGAPKFLFRFEPYTCKFMAQVNPNVQVN